MSQQWEAPSEEEIAEGERISGRLQQGTPDEVVALMHREGSRICMQWLIQQAEEKAQPLDQIMWAAFGLGAYVGLCEEGFDH